MKHVQISISRQSFILDDGLKRRYLFLFRTEWMEYDEGVRLCELFLERFTAPEFKVTLKEKETNLTTQDLN